jgi:hypothetical protein
MSPSRESEPEWLERFGLADAEGLDFTDWSDEELAADPDLVRFDDTPPAK